MTDFIEAHTDPTPQGSSRHLDRRPLYAIAAAIVLVGIAVAWWFHRAHQPAPQHAEAAAFRALQEPRVVLIETLRSYDSEAQITEQLQAAGLTVRRSSVDRPDSERYPPRHIASLDIGGYSHLGSSGTLRLEFFNDRLMEADFRPDTPASYAGALHRRWPGLARDSTGHAELIDTPLRIWSSVDLARSKVGRTLGAEGIVLWQDLRLTAQRDDWDARFGNIPPPAPR